MIRITIQSQPPRHPDYVKLESHAQSIKMHVAGCTVHIGNDSEKPLYVSTRI